MATRRAETPSKASITVGEFEECKASSKSKRQSFEQSSLGSTRGGMCLSFCFRTREPSAQASIGNQMSGTGAEEGAAADSATRQKLVVAQLSFANRLLAWYNQVLG